MLELGCGWGSMSLFMAARYPKSKITAISNSKTQKALIDSRAKEKGLKNLVRLFPHSSAAILVWNRADRVLVAPCPNEKI